MNYTKPFPKSEYDRRIAQTKQSMVAKGFDLIICQDPANMNWLTGFDGWSFYTPQAVLLHLEEEAPIWFGRPQDAKAAHITTDMPPENITTFSETLIHHPTEHPYDDLAALITGRGWASDRIGVELDARLEPPEQIRRNGKIAVFCQLVAFAPDAGVHPEDLMDHDDGSLRRVRRTRDIGVELFIVGQARYGDGFAHGWGAHSI